MNTSELIENLRNPDAEISKNAHGKLRQSIESAKCSVYHAAKLERDPNVKGALIELLGDSLDHRYVPFITESLGSKHADVKFWAFAALQKMSTSTSLEMLQRVEIRKVMSEFRKVTKK